MKPLIKHTLTFLLLSLLSITAVAQDYKANIKQSFTEYTRCMMTGELDKSLNYLLPTMFTLVPREQLLAAMEQTLKGKEIEIKFISFDIKEISNSNKIDTCYYAKVSYVSDMNIKMNLNKVESSEEKTKRLSIMKEAIAQGFKTEVKLDEATETFTMAPTKTSWAISKNGQTDWKFFNVEPGGKLIMEKLLPKELIDESIN